MILDAGVLKEEKKGRSLIHTARFPNDPATDRTYG
jgi:hypothetical protein